MYAVGDKVVHPGYGPGVVTAVEKRQLIGEAQQYYVIDMLSGGGTLRTPVSQAEKIGLRLAISQASVDKLLAVLTQPPRTLPKDFRERQSEAEDRLKGGDLFAIVQVVRDLAWYDRVHGMTRRDTRLMQQAEDLLAAELALVKDIGMKEALDQIHTAVSDAMTEHYGQLQLET